MDFQYFIDQILPELVWVAAIAFVFIYREKLVFEPLSGDDRKIQMDELGKAVILAVFVFCVYQEAYRGDMEQHIFSDMFYFILLGAVFAIAAIKPVMDFASFKKDDADVKQKSPG